MRKLGTITPRELIKILKRAGFLIDHVTGSHYVLRHPVTKRRALVAYHAKGIPKGTAHKILTSAGISLEEL
jgi:predicted RNA binding protein YcfA (HicA-like mRNA interferase family)